VPAITIVAPNSPSARENPSNAPARTVRDASGRLIVKNTRHGPAPSVSAICSYRRVICSKPARAVRTTSGRPITDIARSTAFHVKITSRRVRSSAAPMVRAGRAAAAG
jgi:hypothetical protein